MRVAFVNPQGNFDPTNSYLASHPDFGGQLVYVREVARVLGEMGHHADIITRRIFDPEWPEFAGPTDAYPDAPNVRILRVPCGPERFLPKEDLWPYLGEWVEGVAALYRDEGAWPELWTGHYADGGLAAALLSEASGAPFTFTGHSLGAWKLDGLLQESDDLAALDDRYNFGARIGAERASMARSVANVANSDAERREQYDHAAYRGAVDVGDEGRFAVIPPGVDFGIFDPDARGEQEEGTRGAIREAHERDIAPDRRGLPAVIAWSRLDPKKNHLSLVEAFARSEELRDRANLMMITRGLDDPLRDPEEASGEERSVLDDLIPVVDRANLWGRVSAFGLSGQTALAALYRWGGETGGVFCLPAEYEPFGMTVVEAMASGLPVVATQNGGTRETTDGGHAGLLADPHDPVDIAEKLLCLLSDGAAWKTYADRALSRARDLYNWRRTAEGYLRLAEEAWRGERAGAPSFPLPNFVKEPAPAGLPRLRGWEARGGRP
jgi:sucrose-phosphate synthase